MDYKTVEFPESRIGTFDLGKIGNDKHHVVTLLEINVTRPRKIIREMRKNGVKITFVSWILKQISESMYEHEDIRAYLKGKNEKVIFDDMSMSVMIEKKVGGVAVPIPLLIKKVNKMSAEEIAMKIESAKSTEISGKGEYVIEGSFSGKIMGIYYKLPQAIRVFAIRAILKKPAMAHKMMGEAIFSSMGMSGNAPGWAITKSYHNIAFVMGSIVKKPWVVDNEIRIQEIAHMTVLINHDTVDGVPMARFISSLVGKIENPSF